MKPLRQSQDGNGEVELLSLGFDCTHMVSQLSESLSLVASGDQSSAEAKLRQVESRIDLWIDRLEGLKREDVDEDEILGNLQDARRAVEENIEETSKDR